MSGSVEVGSFFDELRRRKVYRTAAAYGAGAFAVWQAADVAFPALGLPPSLLRFVVVGALLGLPLAVVLSWALELVPQSPRGESTPRPRPLVRHPVLLAMALALVLGVAGWTILATPAMSVEGGGWVLVAALSNETGDTILDNTLERALELSLAQSSVVSLFPAPRVRQGLLQMRRSEDDPLDEATALELAARQGVSAVVVPAVTRIGGRWVLEARLVDPPTGRIITSRVQTVSEIGDLLDGVDRLARELRRDLGETLGSMIRTRISLPQATTGSLAALKAWADGAEQSRVGREDTAGLLYRRAVELDSTFALAQAALGQWYYWNQNDPVRGDSAFDRALAHLEGVTERERLTIRGTVSEWRGDREAAAVWFDALTKLVPQDPTVWSRLGYVYLRLGRDEAALDAYEQAIAIDSLDANAWSNLATLRYGMGELEAAVPLYERAFRLQPELRSLPVLNEEYGHNLILLGRFEEAEALYGVMLSRPTTSRARGLRSMALLRSYTGRYREAVGLLRQAIVLHQAGTARISELRDRSFLAAAYLRLGSTAEAYEEVRASRDLAVENRLPTILLGVAGALAARMGETGWASELLDSAAARSNASLDDRAALEYLQGEIAMAEGDPDRAIEHLEASVALQAQTEPSVRVLTALAGARLARGEVEVARTLLEEVTRATGSRTSRESQEDWILAHFRLGRLELDQGRRSEARLAFSRFLDMWDDGDPELGEVAEARSRLAELTESPTGFR